MRAKRIDIDAVIDGWSKNTGDGDTPHQYASCVRAFRKWLSPRHLRTASDSNVREYLAGKSFWVARRTLSALRSFYGELRRRKICEHDPTRGIAATRPRKAISNASLRKELPKLRWADVVQRAFGASDDGGAAYLDVLRSTFPARDPLPVIYRRRQDVAVPEPDAPRTKPKGT